MVGRTEGLAEIDALFARADADHDGQINSDAAGGSPDFSGEHGGGGGGN